VKETTVVYEQPLNERIRAFLRLEYLFERASYRLDGPSVWDSRTSLDAIIDIMALLTRSDLKTETIKELERNAATLEGLARRRGVDPVRLDEVLGHTKGVLEGLRSTDHPPGYDLRQNELLSYVRQRSSIPAGTCSFDIPAFQHWLERPAEERVREIKGWLSEFDLVQDAVGLCLDLVRQSASATREVAKRGFFQRHLDPSNSCQMIRVVLPHQVLWFPEISGGRHRFSIRFMCQENTATRPAQTEEDIGFELQCCTL